MFNLDESIIVDDDDLYLYLQIIGTYQGAIVRNAISYATKDFLRINRLYCIKKITIKKMPDLQEFLDFIKDFSSLQAIFFKNATGFSNVIFYALQMEKPDSVVGNEFWEFLYEQKQQILEFKKRNKLPEEINQLFNLEISNHSDIDENVKHLDLFDQRNLVYLKITNSTSVKSLSFLATLKQPTKLETLIVDHCTNLDMLETSKLINAKITISKQDFMNAPNFVYKGCKFYKYPTTSTQQQQQQTNNNDEDIDDKKVANNPEIQSNTDSNGKENVPIIKELLTIEDFEGENENKKYVVDKYFFFNYANIIPLFVNLRHISLIRAKVADAVLLKNIGTSCDQLVTLDLHSSIWLTDSMLYHIRYLPYLKTLIIGSCPNITIKSIIFFSYITKNLIQTILKKRELFLKLFSLKLIQESIISSSETAKSTSLSSSNETMTTLSTTATTNSEKVTKIVKIKLTDEETKLVQENEVFSYLLIMMDDILKLSDKQSPNYEPRLAYQGNIEKFSPDNALRFLEKLEKYDFRGNDQYESVCPNFFCSLQTLDMSYCYGIISLDLRLFSNFPFLSELNVSGCNLFAPVDDLDYKLYNQIQERIHTVEQQKQEQLQTQKNEKEKQQQSKDKKKQKLQTENFELNQNTVVFNDATIERLRGNFDAKHANYITSIERLDMQHCTITSYQKFIALFASQVIDPTANNEDFKKVLCFFTFTMLKFCPELSLLKIGNHLRTNDNALFYIFFCNPKLRILDCNNALNVKLENNQVLFSLMSKQTKENFLKLNLGTTTLSGDSSLVEICREFKNLTTLYVSNNKNLTNRSVLLLEQLEKLEFLSLALCENISDAPFENIHMRIKGLKTLDLSGTNIKKKALEDYLIQCDNLTSLHVDQCEHVTVESLIKFVKISLQLKELSVMNCPQITKEAIGFIQINRPNISIIY